MLPNAKFFSVSRLGISVPSPSLSKRNVLSLPYKRSAFDVRKANGIGFVGWFSWNAFYLAILPNLRAKSEIDRFQTLVGAIKIIPPLNLVAPILVSLRAGILCNSNTCTSSCAPFFPLCVDMVLMLAFIGFKWVFTHFGVENELGWFLMVAKAQICA